MGSMKKSTKILLFAIVLVVVLVIASLLSGSNSDNQSTESAGNANHSVAANDVYSFRSEDGKATGKIKVVNTFESGLTSFDFAFVINDDVTNNGYCQSNDADYCKKEVSQQSENIKYRYGLTFSSTESTDHLVAAVYGPIYCNLEKAKADPLNIGYDKIDVECDGWKVPNWKPTSWFVAKNRSSTKDFSKFFSGITLNVYDISDEYVVRVSDGGASITTGGLSYDQILGNKKVGSFSLSMIQ